MIQARIAKRFAGFSLDAEFEAAPGITALFGPPGCGKTLLLDCIGGFVKPAAGRILLDDAILFDGAAGVNLPPRRRNCAYVPPDGALFPHMTIQRNLFFAAARKPRLERHRLVAETIERFRLADSAGRRPHEIAPPEARRAATARALIAGPAALLLDGCGDEALLRGLEFPAPILLATRDLDLCCAAAARMLVIESGRILQRGAPASVIEEPASVEVARLVGIPNLFPGEIAALDPGRDSSRLKCESFELTGPYIPGHFRGDRVTVAIRAENVRVHAGAIEPRANFLSLPLARVSDGVRAVRLEFSGGIFADLTRAEFARQKDNREWQVELPPEALRIL